MQIYNYFCYLLYNYLDLYIIWEVMCRTRKCLAINDGKDEKWYYLDPHPKREYSESEL